MYQHRELFDLWPWLLLLALVHLFLSLQIWWWQRRQFESGLLQRFGPGLSLARLALKWGLWTAGGVWLLYALAVPLGPPTKVEGDESGADVILVVDVSSSMHAQDIRPDRLAALKQALLGFIDRLDGDRVGLVAFAGEAIVACPLTDDGETLSLFLSKLDTDSVPSDGTGLGPALKLALDGFPPDPKRGRLIMLATDGEDTANSDVLAQAQRAAENGIPVFTLGIGTPGGALIPGQRDIFGRVYAKTYQGQPVRTKLDSATLQRIAAMTHASYFEGASVAGLAAAYERVRHLKQGVAKSQESYTREPLYQQPLRWAFWLLALEALLSARSSGWSKFFGRLRRWVPPLALGLLLAAPAFAGQDARQDYNAGNRYFRQGNMEMAIEAYARSLEKDPNGNDAAYNIGLAKERLNDPETAAEAYQEALRLDPKDQQSQKALERALKKIPPPKPGEAAGSPQGSPGNEGPKQSFADRMRQKRQVPQPGPRQTGKPGSHKGPDPKGKEKGPGPGPGDGKNGGGPGGIKPGGNKSRADLAREMAAAGLNQDQVQAMMNKLKLDERRYADAFNPTKKIEKPGQDAALQQLNEARQAMGLEPILPSNKGPERKDW
jgi:Ca-activated chloride channel family protein